MEAKSFTGSIKFDGERITLTKKGAGTKTIPLKAITGVEYKKSGLTSGYLRLTMPGAEGSGRKVRNKNEEIMRDPNAVLFNGSKRSKEFEAVANAINEALYA